MILIIGGKYQGKREFAAKTYPDREVLNIAENLGKQEISGKICVGFNEWFRNDPETAVKKASEIFTENTDVILLVEEVGSGVVPLSIEDRKYREGLGRTVIRLASRSEAVYRVFAGIPEKIK